MQVSTASAVHSSQEFLTSLHDSYLYQHVTEPTHHRAQQRANILDLVMTNESGMIHNLRYGEPIGKSHHSVLDWTFRCYQPQPATKVKKYLYDKGNFLEIREILGGFDWANILCGKSADEMWVAISTSILIAVKKCVPHRCEVPGQSRRRRRPVWMNECRKNQEKERGF